MAKVAPDELPKIGRAFLDNLMGQATAEGGFGHAKKLYADWQRVGPDTKRLLFKDPALVRDLDSFFLLAKRLSDTPNPSGTALTLNAGAQFGLVFTNPTVGVPTGPPSVEDHGAPLLSPTATAAVTASEAPRPAAARAP